MGVVSSSGLGKDSFRKALEANRFPRDLGHSSSRWYARRYGVALVENLERLAARELEGVDVRRIDRTGVLGLLAGKEAVAGLASPLVGEDTALILVSTHGALGFSAEYHERIVTDGSKGLSALLFSSSLLSSAAGSMALALGIRGPVYTLSSGATAVADALELAELLLVGGDVQRVLTVGTEMFHSLYLDAYDAYFRLHARFDRPPDPVRVFTFAEGAVALVVEKDGKDVCGTILGASGGQVSPNCHVRLSERLEEAWRAVDLSPGTADLFLPTTNHSFLDRLEADAMQVLGEIPRRSYALKPRTGEGFAFTSFLQVVVGLLSLEPGQRGLVQGIHFDGSVGAVALAGSES